MRRYLWLFTSMVVVFLLLFAVVDTLDIPLLEDPSSMMQGGNLVAAGVGLGLLIADVLIPVPSSLVMVANGALFGIALGALLSLLGSVGAAAVGFALGRRGGPLLDKLVPEDERERANSLLARWGLVAVIASRPVPILAESVAILAGTSTLSWGRLLAGSVLGSVPAALALATAGATGATLDNALVIFSAVLLLSGAAWWWGRKFAPAPDGEGSA